MNQPFKAARYTSRPASRSALGLGVAAVLMAASPMAMAQSAPAAMQGVCDPEVARQLAQRYQQQQEDLDETMNPLLKSIKDVAEDSIADLSACTEMSWPTMKITYPTMDQIIRGVAQMAVRKACGVARDAISQKDSYFRNSFYLNTRIPGVPNFGITSSGSGSGGIDWGGGSDGASYGPSPGGGTSPPPGITPPTTPPGGYPGGDLFNPPSPPSGPPGRKPPVTP